VIFLLYSIAGMKDNVFSLFKYFSSHFANDLILKIKQKMELHVIKTKKCRIMFVFPDEDEKNYIAPI
jgi:hypothetical protein